MPNSNLTLCTNKVQHILRQLPPICPPLQGPRPRTPDHWKTSADICQTQSKTHCKTRENEIKKENALWASLKVNTLQNSRVYSKEPHILKMMRNRKQKVSWKRLLLPTHCHGLRPKDARQWEHSGKQWDRSIDSWQANGHRHPRSSRSREGWEGWNHAASKAPIPLKRRVSNTRTAI